MALTMFNEASAPYGDLAEIDALDWSMFLDVVAGSGVFSGCLATPLGTPDGRVAVSAGDYRVTGSDKTFAGGNVSVLSGAANADGSTAMAPHATLPRYDLIVLNASLQAGVIHGIAAVKTFTNDFREKSVYPNWNHSTQIVIGVVYVIPLDQTDAALITPTASPGSEIVPKDVRISKDAFHDQAHTLNSAVSHVGTVNDTQHGVRTLANAHALADLSGTIATAQIADGAVTFAKIVDISAASRLVGRGSAGGAGDPEQISLGTGLSMSGTTLSASAAGLATDTLASAKGEIPVASANDVIAMLAPPATRQQRLGVDEAGNVAWAPLAAGPSGVREWDDMLYGVSVGAAVSLIVGKSSILTSGTGSAGTVLVSEVGHPGMMNLDGGTQATGRSHLFGAPTLLGSGRARYGAWVKTHATLSDATNAYSYTIGFADSITGTPGDGVYFVYTHSVNSGKWQMTTTSNSTPSVADSGITVAGATWYFLEVEVNAAGTLATFFIDKTSVGTIATNIPTGAGRDVNIITGILKSAGNVARTLTLDAWYLELDFTTAR